jgi:hypothetical protein
MDSDEETVDNEPPRRVSAALTGVAARILSGAQATPDAEKERQEARKKSFLPAWLLESRASIDASTAQHAELTENIQVLNDGIATLNVMKDKAELHFSNRLKAARDAKRKNAMIKAAEIAGEPAELTAANYFFQGLPLEVTASIIAFGTVVDGIRFGHSARSVHSAIVNDDVWIQHVPIEIYGGLQHAGWRAVAVQLGKQNNQTGLMLAMLTQQRSIQHGHVRKGSNCRGSAGREKPQWEVAIQKWFQRAADKRQLEGKASMTMDTQRRLFITQGLGMLVNMTSHALDHRATRSLLRAGACSILLALLRDDDNGQTIQELACAALANLACDTDGDDITAPGEHHTGADGEENKTIAELNGRRQLEVLSANMTVRKLLCSPSMAPRGHNPSPTTQGLASKHASRLLLNLYSTEQIRLGLQYCTGNPLFDEILDADKPSSAIGSVRRCVGADGGAGKGAGGAAGAAGAAGGFAKKVALVTKKRAPLMSFSQAEHAKEEEEEHDPLELSSGPIPAVHLTLRSPQSPRAASAPSTSTTDSIAVDKESDHSVRDGLHGPLTEVELLFKPMFYFSVGRERDYGACTWIRFEPKQSEAVPGQLRGGGEDLDGRFQLSGYWAGEKGSWWCYFLKAYEGHETRPAIGHIGYWCGAEAEKGTRGIWGVWEALVSGNTTTHVQLKRGGVFRLLPLNQPTSVIASTSGGSAENAYTTVHQQENKSTAAAAAAGATSGGRHGYPQPNWRPRMTQMGPSEESSSVINITTTTDATSPSRLSPPRRLPSAYSPSSVGRIGAHENQLVELLAEGTGRSNIDFSQTKMEEDEALARAIAQSLSEVPGSPTRKADAGGSPTRRGVAAGIEDLPSLDKRAVAEGAGEEKPGWVKRREEWENGDDAVRDYYDTETKESAASEAARRASASRIGANEHNEHGDGQTRTTVSYRDRHRWGRQLQRLDDMVSCACLFVCRRRPLFLMVSPLCMPWFPLLFAGLSRYRFVFAAACRARCG